MMPFRLSGALLALCSSMALSQTVDLNGKVVDEQNHPMAGATVTLVKAGISATTDLQGIFRLRSGATSLPFEPAEPTPSIKVKDGATTFRLRAGAQVALALFDQGGRLVKPLWSASIGPGSHTLPALDALVTGISPGAYLLEFKVNRLPVPFKLLINEAGVRLTRIDPAQAPVSREGGAVFSGRPAGKGWLQKIGTGSAIVDTILVRKTGYVAKRIFPDAYLGTLAYPAVITDDLKKMVPGAWFGRKSCDDGTLTGLTFGLFLCPKGRARGFEEIKTSGGILDEITYLLCDTWTMTGDVLTMSGYSRDTQIGDTWPNHSVVADYYYDYDVLYTRHGPCSVVMERLVGEIEESDCVSTACRDNGSYRAECGYDAECGRCWYCESGACRYGGEGPYGCYRGAMP